jgi:NAD(P)-dependent dehydrogenase (short-subunit alcohol dehydrogenase family)
MGNMDDPRFRLDGKVALVTGSSRGIGEAIALAFAGAGADVIVSSRNLADLEKVAEEIRGLGRRALAVVAHIGRLAEADNLVKGVMEEFNRIDILVNNAATNPTWAYILESEERLWDSIMNLNLKGPFFLSQKVAKIMKEQGGGNIINIASVEGFMVGDRSAIYDISKAGLIHFTKAAASEWAQYNIRVNAIAPGSVKTRLTHSMWENQEYRTVLESKIPLHRIAQPMEMVGAAIYLASDAAGYTTGSLIVVDGGLTIGI